MRYADPGHPDAVSVARVRVAGHPEHSTVTLDLSEPLVDVLAMLGKTSSDMDWDNLHAGHIYARLRAARTIVKSGPQATSLTLTLHDALTLAEEILNAVEQAEHPEMTTHDHSHPLPPTQATGPEGDDTQGSEPVGRILARRFRVVGAEPAEGAGQ